MYKCQIIVIKFEQHYFTANCKGTITYSFMEKRHDQHNAFLLVNNAG